MPGKHRGSRRSSAAVDFEDVYFGDSIAAQADDNPYGPQRRCSVKGCNAFLNYTNKSGLCDPCRKKVGWPSAQPLSKAKASNERELIIEDEPSKLARIEICNRCGVSSDEILNSSKKGEKFLFSYTRALLIYFLVEHLGKSLNQVFHLLGFGSRSTVENGYRRGKQIIELDQRAREIIAQVREKVLPSRS